MPTESIVIVAAIVGIFVVFACVIAWGQRQSGLAQAAVEPDRKRRAF